MRVMPIILDRAVVLIVSKVQAGPIIRSLVAKLADGAEAVAATAAIATCLFFFVGERGRGTTGS